MKLKVGDLILFPGLSGSGEAYEVVYVSAALVTVSWNLGNNSTSYSIEEIQECIDKGTHAIILDGKEKLAFMLKHPDKVM